MPDDGGARRTFSMVDEGGRVLTRHNMLGERQCRRCGVPLVAEVLTHHDWHIQAVVGPISGAPTGYWAWLNQKTGDETLPILRAAIPRMKEMGGVSEDERGAVQGAGRGGDTQACLAFRRRALRSLLLLVNLAYEGRNGRWKHA